MVPLPPTRDLWKETFLFKLGSLCAWGWVCLGVLLGAPLLAQAHTPLALLPTLRQMTAMVPSDSMEAATRHAPSSDSHGISLDVARQLTDSLLIEVSQLRQLRALGRVPVGVDSRAEIRSRLEEIAQEDGVSETVRAEERIFKHLGLVPRDTDLLRVYKDLLEEQLAGFYDIDQRKLIFAEWLPARMQQMVAVHELTHALQDQHFSLRVRKKLRFDNRDAEAAWQALIEGDANAVMVELLGDSASTGISAFVDSTFGPSIVANHDSAMRSEIFLAAPSALRDFLSFPYASGLSFVAALHESGGWQRVDDAFVRPPVSTEQILHPERYLKTMDGPVRIEQPNLHGILSNGYVRSAEMRLGEEDLRVFLKQWLDADLATIAAEGWGGCKASLYSSEASLPEVLALSSVWDSEDDALEIFGALIGALEMRYPQQSGWAEVTNENQIIWSLDEGRQLVNVLQLDERRVTLLEQIATDRYSRALLKLKRETRYLDPTPDLRRARKEDLVWNQESSAEWDSALTLRVALPDDWQPQDADVGVAGDPREVLVAQRPGASLRILVDHDAQDPLGIGGFAHSLAESLQARGQNVYIQSDVAIRRDGLDLYELVFEQEEAGQGVIYYLAVTDLKRGFGCVVIREVRAGNAPLVRADFDRILENLALVPVEDASAESAEKDIRRSNVGGQ